MSKHSRLLVSFENLFPLKFRSGYLLILSLIIYPFDLTLYTLFNRTSDLKLSRAEHDVKIHFY